MKVTNYNYHYLMWRENFVCPLSFDIIAKDTIIITLKFHVQILGVSNDGMKKKKSQIIDDPI